MKFLRENWLWLLLPPLIIGGVVLVALRLLGDDAGAGMFTYPM